MPGSVTVRLPSAPAGVYRAWLAYSVRVEQRIKGDQVDTDVFLLSPPRDRVGEWLAGTFIPRLVQQAVGPDESLVAPELEVDPKLAMEAVEYLARQARWLSPRVHTALGLQPPTEDVEELRARVLVTLRAELGRILRPG